MGGEEVKERMRERVRTRESERLRERKKRAGAKKSIRLAVTAP